MHQLEGLAFESFCALLWQKQGYWTMKTPDSGDGGVDVVAIRGQEGLLIQCKHSTQTKNLNSDGAKEVFAGANGYRAKHPKVNFALAAITNKNWNNTAQQQAELNQVRLLSGDDLAELLRKHPVTEAEFAKFVLTAR